MIYYVTFAISSFFCRISELSFKKKSLTLGIIFALIAICCLTWMCGVRDLSIGTDIRVYGNNTFQMATFSHDFYQYIVSLQGINGGFEFNEIGYTIFNFLVSRFTNDIHVFLFVLGFLINGIIFLSIYLIKDRISLTLAWLTYCFLFFSTTLNLLRQSVALAFVLLGIVLLYRGKIIASFLSFLIALLFHNSAIFAFVVYLFGLLITRTTTRKWMKRNSEVFIIVVLLIPKMISVLNQHGLLLDKYYQYLVLSQSNANVTSVLLRLPMVILIIFELIYYRKRLSKNTVWIYMIVIGELFLIPLQSINSTVGRLMLFFGISKIIVYPMAIKNVMVQNYLYKNLIKIGYLLFLMYIFYQQIIISGYNQIYPFIFS